MIKIKLPIVCLLALLCVPRVIFTENSTQDVTVEALEEKLENFFSSWEHEERFIKKINKWDAITYLAIICDCAQGRAQNPILGMVEYPRKDFLENILKEEGLIDSTGNIPVGLCQVLNWKWVLQKK